MPVIAVVAAIGADVAAAGAVAGTVGGITAITVTTGLEVVAAVGATVAAIGVVTGNKALTMVGGVIGAVGAIGGLASSAGLFGGSAGSSLFSPAASTADTATTADTAADAANAGFGAAGGALDSGASAADAGFGAAGGALDGGTSAAADAASAGTIDSIANQLPQPAASTDATSALGQNPGNDVTTLSDTTNNSLVSKVANAPDPNPTADATAGSATSTDATPPGTAATQAQDLIGTPPAPPGNVGTTDPVTGQNVAGSSGDSVLTKILNFANSNKVVSAGIIQGAGSLLSGLTSTVTPAQVDALNAQANANNAAAALTKQQTANLAMPKSVAYSAPVTGTPGPLVPPSASPAGFINNPPKVASVTGTPA